MNYIELYGSWNPDIFFYFLLDRINISFFYQLLGYTDSKIFRQAVQISLFDI